MLITNVLFLCTTATARSPLAKALFDREIDHRHLKEYFASQFAGTYSGQFPRATDYRMVKCAAENGLDLKNSQSRQLVRADLAQANYIFAMDEDSYQFAQFLDKELSAPKIKLFFECSHRADLREVPDPVTGHIEFPDCAKLITIGVLAILDYLIAEKSLR